MDIPDWLTWLLAGLLVLQLLGLVPVVGRLRGPDAAERAAARPDLAETAGSVLLFGGGLLSDVLTAAGLVLALAGFTLMSATYAVKALRRRAPGPVQDAP
ncbi:hypothetical protein ACIQPQ_05860 [Streptomyces sp. NPDC091281]|uniref:hypothetical protein n=1 Tax=Streptomyces sp. NPDC091281 TaxID=3365985 RepID=UPI00381F7CC3